MPMYCDDAVPALSGSTTVPTSFLKKNKSRDKRNLMQTYVSLNYSFLSRSGLSGSNKKFNQKIWSRVGHTSILGNLTWSQPPLYWHALPTLMRDTLLESTVGRCKHLKSLVVVYTAGQSWDWGSTDKGNKSARWQVCNDAQYRNCAQCRSITFRNDAQKQFLMVLNIAQ